MQSDVSCQSGCYHKGPRITERAAVPHKGPCVIRIIGVCWFYLEEELVLPLNQGAVLGRDENTLRRLLLSTSLVLVGSGQKVVSENNLSFIIIHYNTKNHTPWGKDPQILPH